MNDKNLLNLLEFTKLIDKKVYVFPTSYKDKEYGTLFSQTYRMMYFEKLRGVGKMNVKVKVPENKNLMYTILSDEQLI